MNVFTYYAKPYFLGVRDTLLTPRVVVIVGDCSVANLRPLINKGSNMAENYTLKTGVSLPLDIKTKVKKIADKYHTLSKKKIVVTSGTRTAASQASAMYGKLAGGDALTVYRNQTAIKEIKKPYDDGVKAKKSKADIISDMEKVIEAQIKKSTYISKHLKKGAIDVRSRDMSLTEKENFKKAAKGVATTVILETTPPHFHLQF